MVVLDAVYVIEMHGQRRTEPLPQAAGGAAVLKQAGIQQPCFDMHAMAFTLQELLYRHA
jgi:hypothetical protein